MPPLRAPAPPLRAAPAHASSAHASSAHASPAHALRHADPLHAHPCKPIVRCTLYAVSAVCCHSSVQELCARLRDEYCEEMAVGESGDASALTVEYRDREGAMTQVTSKTRVSRIFEGGVLYVTSSAAPTALVSRASSAASRSTRAESRATSSALTLQPMCGGVMPHEDRGLVDLSLASCCGVQTRHGGLMLTSHTSSAQAVELKRHRRLELERLRAAKFRHYFSM